MRETCDGKTCLTKLCFQNDARVYRHSKNDRNVSRNKKVDARRGGFDETRIYVI